MKVGYDYFIGYITIHGLLFYAKLVVATPHFDLGEKRLGDYTLLSKMRDFVSGIHIVSLDISNIFLYIRSIPFLYYPVY